MESKIYETIDDEVVVTDTKAGGTVESPKSGERLVDYRNVTIERAARVVLKGVTFGVSEGEFCYLTGKVGSGKSSLLKTLYAEVKIPEGDTARVLDYDLLRLRSRQIPGLRRSLGIVFQDFQLMAFSLGQNIAASAAYDKDRSAAANLRFVLKATGWKSKGEIEDRIEEVMKAVGMENKAYKMPHELSGGEQQRVVIARALLNSPRLILADEPTGNLDPQTGYQIVDLLHRLSDQGTGVIMATHNMQMVEDFPARVLRCENKSLI